MSKSNLTVRLATSLVLLPAVLWLVWVGHLAFALLLSTVAAVCALELNLLPANLPPPEALEEGQQRKKRPSALQAEIEEIELESAVMTGAAIVSVAGAFLLPLIDEIPLWFLSTRLILAAVLIFAFADTLLFEEELQNAPRRIGLAVLGAVYPGLLLSSLVRLRQFERGEWWVVLALTVTWLNDTCAYFAGRAFGKRKLAERISPGAALIGGGAAVLGPLGDLSESMLKRAYGAKDSGRLLPGHGGILDRLDALLFNAPFVLLVARLMV